MKPLSVTRSGFLSAGATVRDMLEQLSRYIDVIFVLSQREVRSRFSSSRLGYLWAFITPIGWIGLLAVTFGVIGRPAPIHSDIVTFLMTGMLPYIMFRTTITSMMRTAASGRHLVLFGAVRHSDLLLTTAMLEYGNGLVIYMFFLLANFLVMGEFVMHNLVLVLCGYSFAWALGASFGRMAAMLGRVSDGAGKAVPLLLRPLFLLSGVFYTANELPTNVIAWMAYNPLFHAIEMIRDGVFFAYTSRLTDPFIPILYIVGFSLVSFVLEMSIKKGRGDD